MVDPAPEPKRWDRAWIVAVVVVLAVAVVAGVALFIYYDRKDNASTGEDPVAVEQAALERIQGLQEEFKAYSDGDLDFHNLLPKVQLYVRDHPDRQDGWQLQGQVQMKLEQWAPALESLGKALAIEPDDFQLQKLAGQCAAKLGIWDQAEDHLKVALSMQATRDIHLMLGSVYYQTQRYDLAGEQFTAALQKPARTPPHKAYSGLADLNSMQGEYAQALELVDQAIEWGRADGSVDPWTYPLQKVRILMDAGQMDAAGALLLVVIDEDPPASYTLDYAKLQSRLWSQQGLTAAIPGVYEDLVSRLIADPDRDPAVLGDALADLAHWRLELGQLDRAADALGSLRSVRPNHPRLGELESRLAGRE